MIKSKMTKKLFLEYYERNLQKITLE